MKKIILGILCLNALQSFAQPANDEPCGAIVLGTAIQTGECTPSVSLTWTGATNSATLPFPSCGQWSTGKRDVWYRFTVSANVNRVNIRTIGGASTVDCIMAMYTAASCGSPFTELACNDDYLGNGMPGLDNVPVTSGITYYLRIAQYNATGPNGDMKICINTFYSPGAIDPTKTVGINVDIPQANLDVNGTTILRSNLQLMGGSPGIGKLLTSDADGNASWQAPAPVVNNTVAFAAALDSTRTLFYLADTKLHFGVNAPGLSTFNIGGAYNNSTDEFTAPSAGIYEFSVRLTCLLKSGLPFGMEVHFLVNGASGSGYSSSYALPEFTSGSIGVHSALHTALYNLAAGDKVTVYAKLSSSNVPFAQITNYGGSVLNSLFWGHKVQ